MPHERLSKQTLCAKANQKKPVGLPRKRWLNYIKILGWNRLGLLPSKIQSVSMAA